MRALGFGVAVHVARFGVIVAGLAIAPLLGITGWYAGLFVNALCTIYAAGLVTWLGLWGRLGLDLRWRGWLAAAAILVLAAEVLLWLVPDGLDVRPPGAALWALTLLLVGVNEELVSRGVVLDRMQRAFNPWLAVLLTAALFGLQHLSAFATSSRGAYDVLTNVLVSGCYGFALAAFQLRFAWILPLILLHASADFTTILSAAGHGDAVVAVTLVLFVGLGIVLLRGVRGQPAPTSSTTSAGSPAARPTSQARRHPRRR